MSFADLSHTSGDWLRGSGPESDVVMCACIRLARNLADFPFTNRASRGEKSEVENVIKTGMNEAGLDLPYQDRGGSPDVALGPHEEASILVNDEDHLRIQVLASGFSLPDLWQRITRIDDQLEERLDYAFSPELGYLTVSPGNVGTGLRVGVILHLPALMQTRQIGKCFRPLRKRELAVRGLYGDGTQGSGDLYHVSNLRTLGKSEPELIKTLSDVIPQIIADERNARKALVQEQERRQDLHEQASVTHGLFETADTSSSEARVAHRDEPVPALASLACPCCGTKFLEFRASGRLGCPYDYQVFASGLLPLLRRAHEATRHVGKIPGRRSRFDSVARLRLRASLRAAVAREDYEEAAKLRDQLRQKEGA